MQVLTNIFEKIKHSPAAVIMLSFLAMCLIGGFALMLPWANSNGEWRDFVSAFFMSTSSVCVTGLAVDNVGQSYSLFGQAIILILMQIGGLSYMTITTILLYIVGKKLSTSESKIFDLSNNSDKKLDFAGFVFKIALLTVTIELIGFGFLLWDSFKTCTENGIQSQFMFQALFHAVSAFCNAGITLYSNSLEGFRENYWVLFVFSILPILGGLGYTVLHDLTHHFSETERVGYRKVSIWGKIKELLLLRDFSLHTRVSLSITVLLLGVGIVTQLVLIYAQDLPTLNYSGFGDKFWVSFFQTCAARSSGFNSIPLVELGDSSLLFLIVWMIIGACPGGTGGGIKVTTLAVVMAIMWSNLKNDKDVNLFDRTINTIEQRRAVTVITSTMMLILLCVWLIAVFESDKGMRFIDQFFEVTSAFTTVGLSTGITADLTEPSQLVLCACMIIGRPGPLLFLMALIPERDYKRGRFAQEGILIG